MADLKKVKILFIGMGSIGRKHLSICRGLLPDSKIYYLNERGKHKKNLKVDNIITNVNEAREIRPEYIIIANPSPMHLKYATKFLDVKCKIFIEKPLTNKLLEAKEFISQAINSKAIILTGYNLRFSESLITFKNLIDQNIVGDLFKVLCTVGQDINSWRSGEDYRGSISTQKSQGGGVLLELSHELDYISWIFGKPKKLFGYIGNDLLDDIDVEDNAHIFMKFPKKNSNKNYLVNLNLDFLRHDKKRECYAIGSEGTLFWDSINGLVKFYSKKDRKWKFISKNKKDIEDSYVEQMKFFMFRCNKRNTKKSLDDSLSVLEIIDKVKLSNQKKSIVSLI